MEPIRILVAEMPLPLSQEFTRAIAAQSDMEVVGSSGASGIKLLVEVRKVMPEVVAIGTRDCNLPGECNHLLSEFPDLRILVLDASRSWALQVTPVTHESVEDLIAAIRSAMR